MRLVNGIVIDKEATFGNLKFSALRREVYIQNEDGTVFDMNLFFKIMEKMTVFDGEKIIVTLLDGTEVEVLIE